LRALLSVANRDGISALARELLNLGIEVYATDGTRDHLASDGIEVGAVSDLTHIPQLAGGQVKTFREPVFASIHSTVAFSYAWARFVTRL
jgi:phosphoribosylaminoimidazolecarboxamide formyltransferase/IMP cyclohydrolase